MNLPNFLHFEPFLALRKAMQAKDLGAFEFFDPDLHLTGQERAQLAAEGFTLGLSQLRALNDFTLAYKNSRVILYKKDPTKPSEWVYHLTLCETLEARREESESQLQAITRQPQSASGTYSICGDCLQRLQYKGFDGVRNRHREYSLRVQQEFDLADFQHRYPTYPIAEEPQLQF